MSDTNTDTDNCKQVRFLSGHRESAKCGEVIGQDNARDDGPWSTKVGVLALAFFCILSGHYIMKSASGALQVSALGPKGIPAMTLVVAIAALSVSLCILMSHRIHVRLSVIVRAVATVSVITLGLFPALWKLTSGSLAILVILSLANSVAVTLGIYSVWTLLTSIVPRLKWYHLTVFGAGAQLGVLLSTSCVRTYSDAIPVPWWLSVSAVFYAIGFCLIVFGMRRYRSYGSSAILGEQHFVRAKSLIIQDIRSVLLIPYVRYIALFMVAQAILSDAVQWRVYLAAGATNNASDATAVLARFYQYTGMASLGVQLCVVPIAFYLLKPRWGIVVQPVLALIAVGLMAVTANPSGVMMIAALYNSVDFTVNNCMRESLYGPLPLEIKVYSRSFIVPCAPRLGSLIGSSLMLTLGGSGGMTWNLSLFIASSVWLILSLKAARIYGALVIMPVDETAVSLDSLAKKN